ncbi:MAG: NAD(P)H-hydrate dehydratase [Nitrospiraceae bacterium]
MKIVTAVQMQTLDRRMITEAGIPSLTLMERAGTGVVAGMEQVFGPLAGKTAMIFCGKGNNGGDGFVVARLLKLRRVRVHAVILAEPTELSADAKTMYRRFIKIAGASAVHVFASMKQVQDLLNGSDYVVDALLGTGLSASIAGRYREAIEAINAANRPITAVDLPSGINADTGLVLGAAVQATLTVTLGLPKLGLYLGPGIDHCGIVQIADIGIPPSYIDALQSRIVLITGELIQRAIPRRMPSAHKGSFGHAGIIAGSIGKTGAAALAANAALRVGAGLVTVATPASVNDALEAKLLEVMTIPMPETKSRTLAHSGVDRLLTFVQTRTAVAIGPGLSTHPETVELVQTLVRQMDKPSVLDADALNALAGKVSLLTESKIPPILTPHPGEMARLEVEATPQSVNADRIGIATRFSQQRGVILVLKGARTVVARPDGMVGICSTGNPGMATAGTGDVLTGMITGLLAQGLPQWEAACAGTYLHGLAGDLAAAQFGAAGMTAGDLLHRIPYALIQASGR